MEHPLYGGQAGRAETLNMENFTDRSTQGLLAAANAIVSGAGNAPASVGLTPAVIAELTDGIEDLTNAASAQVSARSLLDASVAAKDDLKEGLLATLRGAARSAYADAAVGDVALRKIGLAPRRSGGVRPQAIFAPTDLVAKGYSDSTVKLSWDRGTSNPQGTTFQIFGSANGLDYEMIDTTTRASIVLSGHAPGTMAWFKVAAKRSGLVSPFSDAVSVYAPDASAAVRLKVA